MLKSIPVAFALLSLIAPAARADTDTALVRQEHVSYVDLDLTSPQDQRTFHARLRRAVVDVCRNDALGSFSRDQMTHCRNTANVTAQREMSRLVQLATRQKAEKLASR